MSLSGNKKNIFNTIGAYTSMMESGNLPDQTNSFSSINNKKDVVPFLLDILKVIVGSTALQELTGQLFSNFVDKAEPELKKSVKNQTIQYNANSALPNNFKTNGYEIPVKQIDLYGKLKTDPNSVSGNLLYDNSKPNFDGSAYNAIKNAGTEITFGNIIMKYDESTDNMTLKPLNGNQSIGSFTSDFIDNIEIVNKKEFMSSVMNAFYGSITSSQNKSIEEVKQELEINTILNHIIEDDENFNISSDEYEKIMKKAEELVNGVVLNDMGCGVLVSSLPLSGMSEIINNISGSTDPNYIGNQLALSIDSSVSDKDALSNNNETIKDGFFEKIIKIITNILAVSISSTPQIRTIMTIINAFQNDEQISNQSVNDSLKNSRQYLNCTIKTVNETINKFIFDLITKYLISLLKPIIRKIAKEKINQYVNIIKSLVAGRIM